MAKELLPFDDMAKELSAEKSSKTRQKIYREISDAHKAELISADVRRAESALTKNNRVNLDDVDALRERTNVYLDACAKAGTIPNVLGLASHGFGVSRQWMNEYMRTHPNSESTKFLEQAKDVFADVLISASLNRTADPTMSIFILKNCAGFVDKIELSPAQTIDPMGEVVDEAELAERIAGSTVDDD